MSSSGNGGNFGLMQGGRSQTSLTSIDPQAQAFLTATGIVDATITRAIDRLVRSLKNNGTWAKYHFIYPIVGGTAASHSFNLVDPRDLDAAYRIIWSGAVTHDSSGVTGGGGWGDTRMTIGCNGLGFYTTSSDSADDTAIGSSAEFSPPTAGIPRHQIHPRWSDGVSYFDSLSHQNVAGRPASTRITATLSGPIGHLGYYYSPSIDLNDSFAISNGRIAACQASQSDAMSFPTLPIHLLRMNRPGSSSSFPSTRTYSLFTSAMFLTRNEAIADSHAFCQFQAELGRSI